MRVPKNHAPHACLLALLLVSASACAGRPSVTRGTAARQTPSPAPARELFDEYLRADYAPADGFDPPVREREGWRLVRRFAEDDGRGPHPGEDWGGAGGGDTALGREVRAVAAGRVVFAGDGGARAGGVVVVEHLFYENEARRVVRSLYAHLSDVRVRGGEEVRRGQMIARVGAAPEDALGAHLHFELRLDETLAPGFRPSDEGRGEDWLREHYAAPSDFTAARRSLHVPQREPALVLVDQGSYRMRLYLSGVLRGEYDISLGQGRGAKEVRGDNRTPKGMYFVIQKHRGEFGGPSAAYFGGHWIKLNYPNRFDAERGLRTGLITEGQAERIAASWRGRAPTLEGTPLGGGIGLHGWAHEWPNDGPRHLSWGCVVMHPADVRGAYELIPLEAMVVIF